MAAPEAGTAEAADATVISEPDALLAFAESFLEENGQTGTVLYARLAGSRGYNIANKGSDCDYYIVYAAPTEHILLATLEGDVTVSDVIHSKPKKDIVAYEVGKYISLAAGGNPQAIEAMFAPNFYYAHPLWEQIVAVREQFVTMKAFRAYLGHVVSEIKQTRALQDYDCSKPLGHGLRLLYETERILAGECPQVWLEEGSDIHTTIMNLKNRVKGSTSRDKLYSDMSERQYALKKEKPDLPNEVDYDIPNGWLLYVRGKFWENPR